MRERDFQFELDRIYFRYCPILQAGSKYDIVVDVFKEHLKRMKEEVMALEGIKEEIKINAGNELENKIIQFMISHNKLTDQGK